ncbi:methyltransferase domain-containing protein [Flavihumibacter sp. UBA7668]|uniref:methyltransferase domain-containing protein n=1 Tax=Flavihumibacter sp. UBA7668 TaxID=1946542 RepID=UPI0025C657C7|nr:methyltransferase domain-containing protein [Flavihumibacter sp. UBA7668]
MKKLDRDYWNERYRLADTGWDIGSASPPLTAYIDQLTDKNIRILIPGCGNGYEVEYLLKAGFKQITVIDIAPDLTEALRKRFQKWEGKELQIRTGNFFELNGAFDLILEQTFFCALDPSLRPDYVSKMASLLSVDGKLVGVLFNRSFEGGPPFGGSKEEYETLFKKEFSRRIMEPCYNSITPRLGAELFIQVQK